MSDLLKDLEAVPVIAYAWRKEGMKGWALGHNPPTPNMLDFGKYEVRELTFRTHHAEIAEALKDARRWKFFCDNIGCEYGDGYTEPRENSACLEWQQGPWIYDGSNGGRGRADTFPGWSEIIDKMMEDEQRSLEELGESIDDAMHNNAREDGSHD